MLEAALNKLFDFQRFERNPELQSIIDDVQNKYVGGRLISLADEVLDMAAGGLGQPEDNKDHSKKEPKHDGHGLL